MTTKGVKVKIGELLLSSGAIDRHQLEAALGYQKRWGGKLGEIVVDMQFTGDDRICGALARQLGIPTVDLASREIPADVIQTVPRAVCEKYKLLPFEVVRQERGPSRLWVAMADPTNLEAIDEVRFRSGMVVSVAAAPASSVEVAIRRYIYGEQDGSSLEPRHAFVPPQLSEPAAEEAVLELSDLFDDGSGQESIRKVDLPDLFDDDIKVRRKSERVLEREILGRLEALAAGREDEPPVPAWKMVGALVQLLVRQGIVRDADFLDDLDQD